VLEPIPQRVLIIPLSPLFTQMTQPSFRTPAGRAVPAVTAVGMHEIDRIAVEEVGLALLMLMGHAGRGLTEAMEAHGPAGPITVVAGGGGIGDGGGCAARHLANQGREVTVVGDHPVAEVPDAPARQ